MSGREEERVFGVEVLYFLSASQRVDRRSMPNRQVKWRLNRHVRQKRAKKSNKKKALQVSPCHVLAITEAGVP